jgi:hypothetical protein
LQQDKSKTPAQHPSSQPTQRTSSPIQPISARSIIHRSRATKAIKKIHTHTYTTLHSPLHQPQLLSLPLTRLPAESDPGSTSSHAKQLQIVQASIPDPGRAAFCFAPLELRRAWRALFLLDVDFPRPPPHSSIVIVVALHLHIAKRLDTL